MSVSVTSVVIQAKSDGISQATTDLNNLTQAAGNTEAATTNLGKSTKSLSNAYAEGVEAGAKLLAQMQKQVDLLGANTSQTNAYNASMKGASASQIQSAMALGAQVDAYKRLASDQSEAIRMNNQLAQSEAQKAASGAAFIKSLTEQATRLTLTGDALKAYNISLIQAQAATLGVSSQAAPLIDSLNKTGTAATGAHSGVAGITREFIVLAHEMSQGQFSRFGGSLMVMAEKFDVSKVAISGFEGALAITGLTAGALIAVIAAVVAVVATLAIGMVTFTHSATALHEFKNEAILTGQAAGVTGDQFYVMADTIGRSVGSIGNARKAVMELASTGKFTGEQIGLITTAAVELNTYGGQAIETTIKQFEKLAQTPTGATERSFHAISKAAMELDASLHFLEPTTLKQISDAENAGKQAEAQAIAIEALGKVEKVRAQELKENMTALGELAHETGMAFTNMWNELWTKKSPTQELAAAKQALEDLSTQKLPQFGSDEQNATIMFDKRQKLLETIATAQAKIDKDQAAAQTGAYNAAVNHAANLATIEIEALDRRTKGEDTFEMKKQRYLQAEADLLKAGISTSQEDHDKRIAQIKKETEEKAKKPRAEGTSGVDATVKELEAQSSAITTGYANQLSLLDKLNKGKLISDDVYSKAAAETLHNQYLNTQDYYNKELDALNTYASAANRTTNERNIAEGKIAELNKQKSKALADYAAQEQNVALVQAISAQKFIDDERDKAEKVVESTNTATAAIQAQIDAYDSLPDSIKKAGVTAKQMQDEVTQQKMDALKAEADLLASNGFEESAYNKQRIKEINDQIAAEGRLRNAQASKEGQDKTNSFNQGSGARSKEAAAQAVSDWQEAGKQIEAALSDSFGATGTTMANFFKAFTDGLAAQTKAQEDYNKVKEAYKDAPEAEKTLALSKAQAKLDSDRFNNQMKGYADIAAGAKGFFKENTTGYKLLDGLEKAFHLFQLANQAEKLVTSLFVSTASATGVVAGQAVETGAVVAAQTAQNAAKVPGVFMAFMSALGPWGAAAAAVAIAAVLGGAFSGGGVNAADTSESRQKTQGTGTVLGDSTAVSDSIKKSLDNIDKNSGLGLVHSASMDVSLKQVVSGIGNLASVLVRSSGLTGTTAADTIGSAQSAFNSILGNQSIGEKLTGGLLGKIVGGIFGGATSVTDTGLTVGKSSVGSAITNGVSSSQYTDTLTKGGLFSSDKNRTSLSSLGSDANDQFSLIIKGLASTITSAAQTLGVGGDAFTAKLNSFVIDIGKVSLKGMTGDQIQTALEGVFSKLGDQMAEFGVAGLAQFTKVGEGYLDTLTRIANDYTQVSDVLAVLGKSFNVTGLAAVSLSEGLIAAAGGLDTLTTNTQYFVTNFLTEAERMAPITASVNAELTRLGQSTNLTEDQFKNLVLAQDLNTASGQAMYAALLNLAPAFKESADYAVALADGTVDLTDAQQKALDKVTKARSALDDAYSTQSGALTDTITKLNAFKTSIIAFQSSLLTGASSPLTAAQKYAQTLATFNTVSAAAKGGDATAQAAFQGAANDLLTASKAYNASSQAYTDDFNKVLDATKALTDSTSTQIDTAQATLDALNKQVDGLLTVNASVLTVTQAIEALQAAITGGTAAGLTNTQMSVVDGSHANGLAYVPKDNYKANLHKGERVLTASENANYGKSDNSEMVAEMKDMKEQLTGALQQLAGVTADSTFKAGKMTSDAIVTGVDESVQKLCNKESKIKVN